MSSLRIASQIWITHNHIWLISRKSVGILLSYPLSKKPRLNPAGNISSSSFLIIIFFLPPIFSNIYFHMCDNFFSPYALFSFIFFSTFLPFINSLSYLIKCFHSGQTHRVLRAIHSSCWSLINLNPPSQHAQTEYEHIYNTHTHLEP